MSDESMAMSHAIRRAARIGLTPTDEITAARQRLEAARASDDPAAIEAAVREADEVVSKLEGADAPDFGAGVGRAAVQPTPSMSDAIRASYFGASAIVATPSTRTPLPWGLGISAALTGSGK
jgi:hypothetical protein